MKSFHVRPYDELRFKPTESGSAGVGPLTLHALLPAFQLCQCVMSYGGDCSVGSVCEDAPMRSLKASSPGTSTGWNRGPEKVLRNRPARLLVSVSVELFSDIEALKGAGVWGWETVFKEPLRDEQARGRVGSQ